VNAALAPDLQVESGRPHEVRTIEPQLTTHMNTLTIKGDWNIIKGKLKQKWASLTDDDLSYVNGKEDELFGRIQKRTGQSIDEVKREINESSCTSCGH
jgi:uncharacterized protein YjbJ (UPF0337 family)